MKNSKILLLVVLILGATNLFAQTSSRLTGKEFKVFINKMENPGSDTQIEDIITFTGKKVNSQFCAAKGTKSSTFTETLDGTKTLFQMTLTQPNGEVWVFDGFMEDNHMGGNLTITTASQEVQAWQFRGMTTQLWNAMRDRREADRANY
jgi:hypothetical protein